MLPYRSGTNAGTRPRKVVTVMGGGGCPRMPDLEIVTPRLVLRTMSVSFLEAGLDDDLAAAEALIGMHVRAEWLAEKTLMELRLEDLRQEPAYLDWSLRAVGLRATREMVGYAGFHTRPNPPYLQPLVSNAVELGYTVFTPFRARGFATEAVIGLIGWAHRSAGIGNFVVSIAPDNEPSRAIAARLGFRRVGEHTDEFDGIEEVFLLDGAAAEAAYALAAATDAPAPVR
jgi:ribosomal-protein-alanine N-acetyltransferase